MKYAIGDAYDLTKKLRLLRQQPLHHCNVIADTPQMISCHDFVLSTIHLACHQLSIAIPDGLRIPPRFAWSNILLATARQDNTLIITDIEKIYPIPINVGYEELRFFGPALPDSPFLNNNDSHVAAINLT